MELFDYCRRGVPEFDVAFCGGAFDSAIMFPVFFLFDDEDHGRIRAGDAGVVNGLAECLMCFGGEVEFYGVVFGEAVYAAAVVQNHFSAAFGAPGVPVLRFLVQVAGVGASGYCQKDIYD